MAIDRFEDGLPPLMEEYRRLRANPPPGPVVLSDRLESYWRSPQRQLRAGGSLIDAPVLGGL